MMCPQARTAPLRGSVAASLATEAASVGVPLLPEMGMAGNIPVNATVVDPSTKTVHRVFLPWFLLSA